METYSVVVSIYGWTIKNTRTGKTLSGTMEEMPNAIFNSLKSILQLGDRTICSASTVPIPLHSDFAYWFRTTF